MTRAEITNYIPQREPFIMIDTIIMADEQATKTSFTIPASYLFIENGYFTEPGLIENMAQTAAAGTGYKAQQENKPSPVGFIGALKNLRIYELPKINSTIITTVKSLHQIMNAHIVHATITIDDREIASCELKIFLQT